MEITAGLVKKLRDKTDAPMMECKRALEQALQEQGDSATEETLMTRAHEILREVGKVAAVKRSDRTTTNGTVAVSRKDNTAVAVALLCETDFVARNEDFIALAQTIADYFAENEIPSDPLTANVGGKTVKELIDEAVGKIRENIQLGSVKRITGDGVVGTYLHHDKAKAALVLVSGGNGNAQDIANKIGIQIVALSPEYISKEQIDSTRLQQEIEIEKQRAIEEGKPPEIAEKIAQGKVSKDFLQQVVLLEQPWYAQLNKKVNEVLQEVGGNISVKKIVRIEAGKEPVESSV